MEENKNKPNIREISRSNKGKRPHDIKYGEEYIQPGDNTRYIRHVLAKWDLPPIDISDPKQVEERIDWYFNQCMQDDMKPTVMGLCNSLGIKRVTMKDWYFGRRRDIQHASLIEKAYAKMEELWENYMLNGKVNPAAGIFLGRNQFNYQDQVEVVVKQDDTLADTMTPEQISAQIDGLIPEKVSENVQNDQKSAE